jgi:hypothetical protein
MHEEPAWVAEVDVAAQGVRGFWTGAQDAASAAVHSAERAVARYREGWRDPQMAQLLSTAEEQLRKSAFQLRIAAAALEETRLRVLRGMAAPE